MATTFAIKFGEGGRARAMVVSRKPKSAKKILGGLALYSYRRSHLQELQASLIWRLMRLDFTAPISERISALNFLKNVSVFVARWRLTFDKDLFFMPSFVVPIRTRTRTRTNKNNKFLRGVHLMPFFCPQLNESLAIHLVEIFNVEYVEDEYIKGVGSESSSAF